MNALTLLKQQHSEHQFKDKKRHLWLFGLAYPCIAMGALAGYQFGPQKLRSVFASTGPIFMHVAMPALDKLIGEDSENPPDAAIES